MNNFGSIGSQKTSSVGFPKEYNCCGVKSIIANKFSPFSKKLKLPNFNSIIFSSTDLNSFMKVQIVYKTLWTFRPPITKLPIQALWQTISVRKWTQVINRIGKQSKPIKITSTAENKRQKLKEERCKYKDNTTMCYRRGSWSPQHKTSPPVCLLLSAGDRSNIILDRKSVV